MNKKEELCSKRNQRFFIIQSSLEGLTMVLIGGSFLATLTKELGFSDGLTGVLSSVISLGCLFQLLSILIRPKKLKSAIIITTMVNQLLFSLLYVFPFVNVSQKLKTVLFAVFLVGAHCLYNSLYPKKISWMLSVVDDNMRGRFTANKEVVALSASIVFSYTMGWLVDWFSARGQIKIAFSICCGVMLVLMLLHSLALCFIEEKEIEHPLKSLKNDFFQLIKNKRVGQVITLYIIYHMGVYSCVPFFGTYQIKELGLSLSFITTLSIVGTILRIITSKPWGVYADRSSFAATIEKSFWVLAASYLCVVFATPSNGAVMFALYNILNCIAASGLMIALTNLVFDYVPQENRSDAMALSLALSGVAGFITTLCISPLIGGIQENGNRVFGLPMYAQQVVAVIGMLLVLGSALYVRVTLLKHKREDSKEENL